MIDFDSDTFQVAYAGERIVLLPKEFGLFRYLYEHEGRSFAREELLDAVWPLEAPTDRTVDDHIYRIRRKIARWSHLLSVDTIRGQGYKLTRRDRPSDPNPLLRDEQFSQDVSRMLGKYHSLGMGAALQLLAANKDTLGLPGDPYYDVYVHFVQGDFGWLLRTDSVDEGLKAAYAVFIHAAIQLSPERSLPYFEKLIARGSKGFLPFGWLADVRLNAISLYLESGKLKKAREQIAEIHPAIASMDSPSFTAIYLLKKMYLLLLEGNRDEASAVLRECESLLERHPIGRERGAFFVGKAISLYENGEISSARQALDEGIEILRHTRFVPHLIAGVNTILKYLTTRECDESYRSKNERTWELLAEQYGFEEWTRTAERWLDSRL